MTLDNGGIQGDPTCQCIQDRLRGVCDTLTCTYSNSSFAGRFPFFKLQRSGQCFTGNNLKHNHETSFFRPAFRIRIQLNLYLHGQSDRGQCDNATGEFG